MRNADLWTESKYVRRGGRLRGSRDLAEVGVGSRLMTDRVAALYEAHLPRYARGKTGTVERDYGVFVFPDTNAQFLGEKPQHVYSVRFAAQELWGQQAKRQDAVYVNMWDDYLEPA